MSIDVAAVKNYLLDLQQRICAGLEQEESGACFVQDVWQREVGGGGGITRVLENGAVFEVKELASDGCVAGDTPA